MKRVALSSSAYVGIGIVTLIILSFSLPSYYLHLLTRLLIFAIFAMSLNLLFGYTGLPSFGHAAFFGSGAYAIALLSTKITDNFYLVMLASLVFVTLLSALFGFLCLRLSGAYFILLSVALAAIPWAIAVGWKSVTGGDDGIPGIQRPSLSVPWTLTTTLNFFHFVLIFFLIAAFVLWVIGESPFGQVLIGIRENESRMGALGYNTTLYKRTAFIIAGIIAGLAGALYAYFMRHISPEVLSLHFSLTGALMVILGGAGTFFGPVIGATVIVALESFVSTYTERWLSAIGIAYILVVVFMPGGIYELLSKVVKRPPGKPVVNKQE